MIGTWIDGVDAMVRLAGERAESNGWRRDMPKPETPHSATVDPAREAVATSETASEPAPEISATAPRGSPPPGNSRASSS